MRRPQPTTKAKIQKEILLMKQQFVITYNFKKETKKKKNMTDPLQTNTSCLLCFHENIRKSGFFLCGHNSLTDGVSVTQLSINVGISV